MSVRVWNSCTFFAIEHSVYEAHDIYVFLLVFGLVLWPVGGTSCVILIFFFVSWAFYNFQESKNKAPAVALASKKMDVSSDESDSEDSSDSDDDVSVTV